MTCALVKQSSRWHGRMPDVQNCALGVQKADDMCNLGFFSNKPMSSVYCSLRLCRLDIQDCTCDTLQFTTKRHMTWTHNRGKTHQKGMKTHAKNNFEKVFLFQCHFSPCLMNFHQGLAKSWHENQDLAKNCQKSFSSYFFNSNFDGKISWHESQDLAKNCQKSASLYSF